MSTTVTGKLNRAAREKQLDSGDFLFMVSIGKKEYDRKLKQSVYTNYSAVLYAKQGKQADFYRSVLQEGAIVSVSGSGLIAKIWGENNDKIQLDLVDSHLEYGFNPNSSGMIQAVQQQVQQQAPQQAPAVDNFDDDIPF